MNECLYLPNDTNRLHNLNSYIVNQITGLEALSYSG
jgi:hypothetical protein